MKAGNKPMYWPINDYSINEIFLDSKNIRLPVTNSAQDAILQDLFSNEDTFELVKSIAQYGLFPDEFPILIKENKKFIVVEGNRRLAALKALDVPDRVPLFKSKLKQIKNPELQTIKAVLAPSRDAAISLIANKHTINLRRPWKPLRQAYFYKSQIDNGKSIDKLKSEYPEHDIPKFIRMLETHHLAKSIKYDNPDVARLVHDDRKFPITNLERMYEDTYVSDFLGISFNKHGKIKGNIKRQEFEKAYRKLIEDVATGRIDSRQYNNKNQRKTYIDNFPDELRPSSIVRGSFKSSSFKELKAEKHSSYNKSRTIRNPKGLIPSYIPFKLTSSPLKTIYTELRKINVHDFPNAAHDLLRSFLECVLAYYLKNSTEYSSVDRKGNSYNPGLKEMLNFISSEKCSSLKDNNIKQVASLMIQNYAQPYSLLRFNMINHNENWTSNEKDVRDAWNKMESLMRHLLNENKNE